MTRAALMAHSQGLELQYGAIIDGIALLKDMQPSISPVQVSRLSSARGGGKGPASWASGSRQRPPSSRPGSRVGTAAGARIAKHSAEYAAFDSLDAQPALTPTLRTRTARPESRERVSSAWAAPQYSSSVPQQQPCRQLAANSWMPSAVPLPLPTHAHQTSPVSRTQQQPALRLVTAPQVATVDYPRSQSSALDHSARKLRPGSAQRQASPAAAQRSPSRQQDQKRPLSTGGTISAFTTCK